MKTHTPLRMCMACRNMKPKNELIRLVCSDKSVVVDEGGKIQARGAYVCNCPECIALLKKKRCLERQFGGECSEAYEALLNMFSEG